MLSDKVIFSGGICFLMLLSIVSISVADTVYLKDGRVIIGSVVEDTPESVKIDCMNMGVVKTYKKSAVDIVAYDEEASSEGSEDVSNAGFAESLPAAEPIERDGLPSSAMVGQDLSATELEPRKLWALATSALLTEFNHGRHDSLAEFPVSEREIIKVRQLLEKWWDITNREDLLETLQWIDDGGHRRDFEKMGEFAVSFPLDDFNRLLSVNREKEDAVQGLTVARTYYAALGKKSLLGWDYARYVSLCRWGYMAGYFTETEAWEKIMPVAGMLQATFDSWTDLGKNYLIGRKFWSRAETKESGERIEAAYEKLISDTESPWNKLAWSLNLND